MSDSYETAEALYSQSEGMETGFRPLNEHRVTLTNGEVFTAFGIGEVRRQIDGWVLDFQLTQFENRIEFLSDIQGFEIVER